MNYGRDMMKRLPSHVDYNNWKQIMSRSHNSEILVFIILGRKNLSIWIGEEKRIVSVGEVDV